MQFLYPAGSWALTGLLAVLALYILRKEYRELNISSTYLWRRTLEDQTASRPFQKLKSNLLMFLQLSAVLLLALSLMRPLLPGAQVGGETVMIFDVSMSMQTSSSGQSRIGQAVSEARRMVEGMGVADRLTILSAGKKVTHLLSRSTDRQEASKALSAIAAENGDADVDGALSLAKAMGREIKNLNIVVFSDTFQSQGEDGVRYVAVGEGVANCAILSLTASQREEGMAALARIINFGSSKSVTVRCYADGQLCDARTVELAAGATQSVHLTVPENAVYIRAEIAEEDGLLSDNQRYFVMRERGQKKIALIGKDDIFLEKALLQRGDVELIRTTLEDAPSLQNCSLYVYDGVLPGKMPESGSFLILAPAAEILGVAPGGEKAPEFALNMANGTMAGQFSDHVSMKGVAIKQYSPLSGGQPVLVSGGDTLISAGEENGSRFVVIGFDLHESNWVLKYDFPIFMMHALNYLMPDVLSGAQDALCGDVLSLSLDGRTEKAVAVTPAGKSVPLAPPFPALPFDDTGEAGLYTLSQTLSGGETVQTPFVTNVATVESDVREVAQSSGENQLRAGVTDYGREFTTLLIIALLALMMAEWWVSCRAG
jgi:hypothetical protein